LANYFPRRLAQQKTNIRASQPVLNEITRITDETGNTQNAVTRTYRQGELWGGGMKPSPKRQKGVRHPAGNDRYATLSDILYIAAPSLYRISDIIARSDFNSLSSYVVKHVKPWFGVF